MMCRGLQSISVLTNLRHLNLSDTATTDHGMCCLARMKRLKYLNLSHSGVPSACHANPVLRGFKVLHPPKVLSSFVASGPRTPFWSGDWRCHANDSQACPTWSMKGCRPPSATLSLMHHAA